MKKSEHDHREYRYLRLKNKMKVLLVHDEAITKSADTLYVSSGNLNNPPEVNGIAHFCEHMLFLGAMALHTFVNICFSLALRNTPTLLATASG